MTAFNAIEHPRGARGRFTNVDRPEGDTELADGGLTLEFDGVEFHDCQSVRSIEDRSPDAAHILEEEEDDWEWHLVPAGDYPNGGYSRVENEASMEEAIAGIVRMSGANPDSPRGAELAAEQREQMAEIEAWMREYDSPLDALNDSPPLIGEIDGQLQLLDGWHRMTVARHVFGITAGPLLVGRAPAE